MLGGSSRSGNERAEPGEMESNMRATNQRSVMLMGTLLLLGMLAVLPAAAEAGCPAATSTVDTDNDGFTDAQECAGIPLNQGSARSTTFPSCFTNNVRNSLARSACLHPDEPDLFVALVPTATTLIPADPFEYVRRLRTQQGLEIAVHQLTATQVKVSTDPALDRLLTSGSPQKAVRVTESAEGLASGAVLGNATNGTPNTTGKVVVWPVRILEHINQVRTAAGVVALPATDQLVVIPYIKQVIAHEMGHVLGPLANVSTKTASNYGGKHYSPDDHVIMSQYVTNDGAGNFTVGPGFDIYKTGDQAYVILK
jgi:hypothetical protein